MKHLFDLCRLTLGASALGGALLLAMVILTLVGVI